MMRSLNSISHIPNPMRFSLLPSLAILLLSALADVTLARNFDLVVLIPNEVQPSIFADSLVQIGQLATERINSDADLTGLSGHTLRIKKMVAKCNERAAMKGVIDALLDKRQNSNTAAFIGPMCEEACPSVSALASTQILPVISYGCSSAVLADTSKYPTFFRTCPSIADVHLMMEQLLLYFRWTKVALISLSGSAFANTADQIEHHLRHQGADIVSIHPTYNYSEVRINADINESLLRASQEAKVIILCVDGLQVRNLMSIADSLDLLDGRYVFISINALIETFPPTSEMEGLVNIGFRQPRSEEFADFYQIPSDVFGNYSLTANDSLEIDVRAEFLYRAVWMHALVLNESLPSFNGVQPTDDQLNRKNMRTMRSRFNSGWSTRNQFPVSTIGSRIMSEFSVQNVQNGSHVTLFDFISNGSAVYMEAKAQQAHLPGERIEKLGDRPICTLKEPICPPGTPVDIKQTGSNRVAEIVGGTSFVIVTFFVAILISSKLYRNFKAKQEEKTWKINYSDLHFYANRQFARFASSLSRQSWNASEDLNCNSRDELEPYGGVDHDAHEGGRYIPTNADPTRRFTTVAVYQAHFVAVKPVRKPYVCLTLHVLKELRLMKTLSHANLNPLIGVCIDHLHVSIVNFYCAKGSLQDVLENSSVKLDRNFLLSFATDIVLGMIYLHDSCIRYHGQLKSSNILIDSRWSCRLADYGLRRFREGEKPLYTPDEQDYYYQLLWTAPEHLREDVVARTGSQKGDVYSFGIILHEIAHQSAPYDSCDEDPKTIVERVTRGERPVAFRPSIERHLEADDGIQNLMALCWDETPAFRPNFMTIKNTLRQMNRGRSNLVDHMMETYANQLEELVKERTHQLAEEQKKTDELLCRMLPRSVADELKQGHHVQPYSFNSVTVFFSDIVGFTSIAASSTPLEVVTFLNDLYTAFDETIETYDIYKVETIGDSYVVVSGLPIPNGRRHADEICTMALDLLSQVRHFKIRHRPDHHLQLRIGVHTGPVVAGVVGVKMPRYCLFGDTVNYASRMESSGLALRIHVSPECKDLLDQFGTFQLEKRGPVTMKGKGTIVTYWLLGKIGFDKQLPDLSLAASIAEHEFK